MKDKVNKQIKRFLKSRSEKVSESKVMESYYYEVMIDDSIFKIRFSNHIKPREMNLALDIISISSGYLIKVVNSTFYCNDDTALQFVKGIIIILPELIKENNSLREVIVRQNKEMIRLANVIDNLKRDISKRERQDDDQIINLYLKERDDAIAKYKKITKESETLQVEIRELKRKLTKTLNILETLKKNLANYFK